MCTRKHVTHGVLAEKMIVKSVGAVQEVAITEIHLYVGKDYGQSMELRDRELGPFMGKRELLDTSRKIIVRVCILYHVSFRIDIIATWVVCFLLF